MRRKPRQHAKSSAAVEKSLADDLKSFRIGLDAAMAACPAVDDPTPKLERLLGAGYRAVKVAKPN